MFNELNFKLFKFSNNGFKLIGNLTTCPYLSLNLSKMFLLFLKPIETLLELYF